MNKILNIQFRIVLVLLLSTLILSPTDVHAKLSHHGDQNVLPGAYDDLVVGVPGEVLGASSSTKEGAANVLYSTADGLTGTGNQFWHQDVPGIPEDPENEDQFGLALTTGDFNHDGYSDLAIGAPYDEVHPYWGVVHILYGSVYGLTTQGTQLYYHEIGGLYGSALASGDLNGDSFDDLVISAPFYSISVWTLAVGAVHVLYGSADGLTLSNNQVWTQGSPGILGDPEANDRFGSALAIGDINGDGYDDLAVGVGNEDVNGADDAGAVNVIYGSSEGLTYVGNQLWHKDQPDIGGTAAAEDWFGRALSIADYNGDGYAELAIGVPGDDYGTVISAGTAYVLPGSASGLVAAGHQIWHQDADGIEDSNEMEDRFGMALASSDLNADGYRDLIVGVPWESIESLASIEQGAVNVIYGSSNGLTANGNQIFYRGQPGMEGEVNNESFFGYTLVTGDINGDGYHDLAVGAYNDMITGKIGAGSINIIFGSINGLTLIGNEFWHQDQPGILESADLNDQFGTSLAIGNFNGTGILQVRLFLPGVMRNP